MIKKYFKYELKKAIWPTIILTILGILIYIPILASSNFVRDVYYNPKTNIGTITTFLAIVCTVVPIYEFRFLMKKRSIDQLYSLPIKRESLILCKLVAGYLKILIAYSIAFFLGLLVIIMKGHSFNLQYYIPLFFMSIIFGLFLYGFNCFIFSRANTIIDGIIFIFFYIFAVFLIILFVLVFLEKLVLIENIDYYYFGFSYSPLVLINNYYDSLIAASDFFPKNYDNNWISYVIWIIVGITSFVGIYISPKYDKAERAEQISNSYFGYSVIIPVYLFLLIFVFEINPFRQPYQIMIIALLFGASIIGYIIYLRTFKLKLKYWIIVAIIVIVGIIASIL